MPGLRARRGGGAGRAVRGDRPPGGGAGGAPHGLAGTGRRGARRRAARARGAAGGVLRRVPGGGRPRAGGAEAGAAGVLTGHETRHKKLSGRAVMRTAMTLPAGMGRWLAGIGVAGACVLCCVVPPAVLVGGALTAVGTGLAAIAGGLAMGLVVVTGVGAVAVVAGLVFYARVARKRRQLEIRLD